MKHQQSAITDASRIDPAILDAGKAVMSRAGVQGATMERIAEQAGVSRVTLHRRGITKEVILGELVRRGLEHYRALLWPALTAPGDGRERLSRALDALCESAEANLELMLALRSQSDAVFHEAGSPALTRSEFTEPFERILRDGAMDGSLKTVDPVETATILFNMVGWTYVHLRSGHGWSPKRASSAVIRLTLEGLVKEGA